MTYFFQRLSAWWFAAMTPASAPASTLHERETLRQRRLLSVILLILFLWVTPFIPFVIVARAGSIQLGLDLGESSAIVLALWLNRCGYLKRAGLLFLLASSGVMAMSMLNIAVVNPISIFYIWTPLLLFPIIAALFLSFWGPLLLALLEVLFLMWFTSAERTRIIALSGDPQYCMTFLGVSCVVILLVALLSALYAVTTTRAVVQADRAVELERAHQALRSAHSDLEQAHAQIQQQALTDPLTHLSNHGTIIKQIEAELQQCRTSQRDCAIIFVDIDHFKCINDTWGHAAGDAALCAVGHRLRAGIRKDDCIGRYGGEEFAILLSDIDQSEAFDLAERLRCSIAEAPCLWQRAETQSVIPIPLTASFGLAAYPLDGLSARELLDMADTAMYMAKHTGRNRVCLPDEVDTSSLKEDKLPQYSEQTVLQTVSTMAAFHNQDTQAHANHVVRLAEATMRALGRSEDEVALLRLAAQVHDIGKIGIPDAILQKPGPLTQDEWSVMRRHPQIGQQILTQTRGQFGLVSHIVVAHHERWDGQGYPYGLAQQEIPLGARLLSVIETYDAMTSAQPYREALSAAEAREELQRCAGSQFDPQVVAVFLQTLQAQESQGSIVPVSASL
jgi:diguanylate cyclase (GGDEF)-like protein